MLKDSFPEMKIIFYNLLLLTVFEIRMFQFMPKHMRRVMIMLFLYDKFNTVA